MDPDSRTLEQLRQRLVTLSKTLHDLKVQTEFSPVDQPTWDDITIAYNTLASQLSRLQAYLNDADRVDFLRACHPYPNSTFPATQEVQLNMLMRKQLEPTISSWQERLRDEGAKLEAGKLGDMRRDQWLELWDWAVLNGSEIAKEELHATDLGQDFDDEEEDDDEMEIEKDTPLADKVAAAVAAKREAMMNMSDLMKATGSGEVSRPPPMAPASR
ncbi:hypothetical protein BT63DRAFT_118020 [Microthyrium microscopicum]|uniref:Mediator of RNA polymerase II transcription subunit 8 n=1 Tax=Microthyrium microscopicum TaxID=703497 RepID=A0A6A6TWS7_9PEZI|nr:hypothetical protein BT63DRAFT_118020 [Microthyrium microscopicum]